MDETQIVNIITVKQGNRYGHEYVNKMYNMVRRNITFPFRFHCITDDHTGIRDNIRVISLPEDMPFSGWWVKPYMFKTGLFKHGINLYFDLDLVIVRNIDKLITYMPGSFVGARDYAYTRRPDFYNLASGIMRWVNGSYNMIWTRLERDQNISRNFAGDQEYIYHYHKKDIKFYPEDYAISYRWQYEEGKKTEQTCVLDFHGRPKPHEVDDKYIKEHWQ